MCLFPHWLSAGLVKFLPISIAAPDTAAGTRNGQVHISQESIGIQEPWSCLEVDPHFPEITSCLCLDKKETARLSPWGQKETQPGSWVTKGFQGDYNKLAGLAFLQTLFLCCTLF